MDILARRLTIITLLMAIFAIMLAAAVETDYRRSTHNTTGKLDGAGADYSGSITDPAADKTYSGSGTVKGNSLRMKGCVLAVLCKSQTWSRL